MATNVEALIQELNPVTVGEGQSVDSDFARHLLGEILASPTDRGIMARPRAVLARAGRGAAPLVTRALSTRKHRQRRPQLADSGAMGRSPRTMRRRVTLISLAGVLVVAGTAAAITFLRSPVRNVTTLSCYEKVSLHTNIDVIAYSSDPLAACGALMHWRSVPASSDPHGTLCLLSNGSLAGFPPSRNADVCGELGLATFNGRVQNSRSAQFQRAALAAFTAHPCMTPETAHRKILQLLKHFGLVGWKVREYGTTSPAACATLGLQPEARIVDIVRVVM